LDRWSVSFDAESIVTSDGSGSSLKLPVAELHKVVVQTDGSGPWGPDVLYFLFGSGPEPAGVFPIEAQGRQEFVRWLSTLPGYRDGQHRQAMGSTDFAKFVIFEADMG
jgi:hypothetical protein